MIDLLKVLCQIHRNDLLAKVMAPILLKKEVPYPAFKKFPTTLYRVCLQVMEIAKYIIYKFWYMYSGILRIITQMYIAEAIKYLVFFSNILSSEHLYGNYNLVEII